MPNSSSRAARKMLPLIMLLCVSSAGAEEISYGLNIPAIASMYKGSDGYVCGTEGAALASDAFIVSKAPIPIEYRVNTADKKWHEWKKIGELASGAPLQIEAIQFRFPGGAPSNFLMLGRAHIQDAGWSAVVKIAEGTVFGTVGEGRRLEAVQLVAGLAK